MHNSINVAAALCFPTLIFLFGLPFETKHRLLQLTLDILTAGAIVLCLVFIFKNIGKIKQKYIKIISYFSFAMITLVLVWCNFMGLFFIFYKWKDIAVFTNNKKVKVVFVRNEGSSESYSADEMRLVLHEFNEENTYYAPRINKSDGKKRRQCKICRKILTEKYRLQQG